MRVFVRSILSIGESSGAVTLPIPWLRYYGLKPGDKVEVITRDEVIVGPSLRDEESAEKQGESK
jgi:bifunctional DNA-binding transcriptional regulator/antitoxin component of YhaV-PrlF toxin-antitoxin module